MDPITLSSHTCCSLSEIQFGFFSTRSKQGKSADFLVILTKYYLLMYLVTTTDYGRPERKKPSLHGRKFTPTPKFLGTAKAYFVCHFGPIFQISLIYAFIGCP